MMPRLHIKYDGELFHDIMEAVRKKRKEIFVQATYESNGLDLKEYFNINICKYDQAVFFSDRYIDFETEEEQTLFLLKLK